MSTFPTEPAFVVTAAGWSANLLAHPMMQFLHAHEKIFDTKDYAATAPYYHPTAYTYVKSTGEVFNGPAAIQQLYDDHALFAAHFHEPVYGVITTLSDGKGYRLFGYAHMYIDLPGATEASKSFSDLQGRKWECKAEGAFIFDVERTDEPGAPMGMRFTKSQIFVDPSRILALAVKKGVVPVEALTG